MFNFVGRFRNQSNEGYSSSGGAPRSESTSSTSHSYFEKKGEVNEIKKSLKSLLEKPSLQIEELHEAMKKVIGLMTFGIDLSSIFTDIVMVSYTNDLVCKKMIYLYIITYAEMNEESAVMSLNTFLKDCNSPDGKIRGLALRSLCGLKTIAAADYAEQMVLKKLDDADPYVRKIAVLGVLRIFYQNAEFFEKNRLLDRLYNLIKDPNKTVVVATISVLEELMVEEGGMAINHKVIVYLINRIRDFNTIEKQTILKLLERFEPKNDEETYNIMGLLEELLKHSSPSLCLAILAVYLSFAKKKPELLAQICQRLAPILVSVSTSVSDEELFVVLTHIVALIDLGFAADFKPHYKLFFVRAYEKGYNVGLKIKILLSVVSRDNLSEIFEEIGEYASEGTGALAREAIRAYAEIGSRFSENTLTVLKRLLILLKLNRRELFEPALSGLRTLIDGVADLSDELSLVVEKAVEEGLDTRSTLVLLEIFAACPTKIRQAPYIIESLINSFAEGLQNPEKASESRTLALALMNCTVRVFAKRAGEVFPLLVKLFSLVLEGDHALKNDADVRERALFYYNHLRTDVIALSELLEVKIKAPKAASSLQEISFNDLGIVFKKKPESFVKPLDFFVKAHKAKRSKEPEESKDHQDLSDGEQSYEAKKSKNDDDNFLDLDPEPHTSSSRAKQGKKSIELADNFEIDDEEFQTKWTAFEEEIEGETEIESIIPTDTVESKLAGHRVFTMASGSEDDVSKFYLFAKVSGSLVLVELLVDQSDHKATWTLKSTDLNKLNLFGDFLKELLIHIYS